MSPLALGLVVLAERFDSFPFEKTPTLLLPKSSSYQNPRIGRQENSSGFSSLFLSSFRFSLNFIFCYILLSLVVTWALSQNFYSLDPLALLFASSFAV